jgi:alkylhydroperoxidase/carboxymuconolactone decarboxylase family protein YurZ
VHNYLSAAENSGPVSRKMRHLIWVAVDLVTTHLYPRGAGVHAQVALKEGATVREVIEAIEIASSVSSGGYGACLPIVISAARENNGTNSATSRPVEGGLRKTLEMRLGYWEEWMGLALAVSPVHFETMVALQCPEPETAGLDAKSRELILMAGNACPAILNREGVERHAGRAARLGATETELVQVLQLANGIGLHPISEGVMAAWEHLHAESATRSRKNVR